MDARFVWGVVLLIVSLIIGKITTIFLVLHYTDPTWRWSMIAVYAVTWPMMIFGIWLCGPAGVKYAERFTKYASYKYYHRQAKRHVPRLARRAQRNTKRIVAKGRRQTRKLHRALFEK